MDIDSEKEERILTFMESMAPRKTPFLNRLEKEALGAGVPIIRPQTQSLIQFLMTLLQPRRILEVGTGTGFSACLMKTYAAPDAQITTIEKDPARAEAAGENFRRMEEENPAPQNEQGRGFLLIEGDAAEKLAELDGAYDFIFMDAAKGQYIHFLPDVLRLLEPGAVLLSDNIFKGGEVLESRYAVKRRDRTIHRRMREYLQALTHDPSLQTLLLEEGDGAALTVKRQQDDRSPVDGIG